VTYKRGGKTFTGSALKQAKSLFPSDNGGRKQVLILITGNFVQYLITVFFEQFSRQHFWKFADNIYIQNL